MYILSYSRLVLKKQQKISRFFSYKHIWVFPKIGYPQIIDSKKGFPLYFGVPLFLETPIWFIFFRFEKVCWTWHFSKNNALDSPMFFPGRNSTFIWWSKNPNATTPEKVTGTIDLNRKNVVNLRENFHMFGLFFWVGELCWFTQILR